MPMTKQHGNMYDWVTHMHTHLGGECPHECSYCYVDNPRFGRPIRYQGKLRLIEVEFNVRYRSNQIVFIEHQTDLFAEEISAVWINGILAHCKTGDALNVDFVFQTKNPMRITREFGRYNFPQRCMIGTTIESNRNHPVSWAPVILDRIKGIAEVKRQFHVPTFITIEPILDFDVDELLRLIVYAQPEFINIGADSKRNNLPEPSKEKVLELLDALESCQFDIRGKSNLKRIIGDAN